MARSIAAPHSGEAEKRSSEGPSTADRADSTVGSLVGLAVASIGVVYGDIGTSPLYAFREAVNAAAGEGAPAADAVYGVLSLILWALIFIVTFKYVIVLLRADNNGEGGTLTLMALARNVTGEHAATVVMLGIIGAALFFGDALITPAISVLSAIEGLKDVDALRAHIDPYIVPLTVAILVVLFAVQSRGTAGVAVFFGPVMTVWFLAIAVPGVIFIASDPRILLALNPFYGISFLFGHGMVGLFTLGAVFLAVTGAEALYADLGHFGRAPIQAAWFVLVFPALDAQLSRPGRARSHQSDRDQESVLPALSGTPPAADGGAGDGRHRHRQPGGDHRRLLVDSGRRSRLACCRAWRSDTPPRNMRGRSTCRG